MSHSCCDREGWVGGEGEGGWVGKAANFQCGTKRISSFERPVIMGLQ